MTTISKVEVTADLKWGRVWITILGDEAEQKKVFKILKSNLAELQQGLIEKFDMKIVPRVKFIIDHAEEYAAHINELLRKTHE
jgi:ribosome-binding factor A